MKLNMVKPKRERKNKKNNKEGNSEVRLPEGSPSPKRDKAKSTEVVKTSLKKSQRTSPSVERQEKPKRTRMQKQQRQPSKRQNDKTC